MSASMFTTIYVAAFRPDALSFLFFIALGPAVLGLLAVPFLDVSSEEGAACAKDAGKGEQPVSKGGSLAAVAFSVRRAFLLWSYERTLAAMHRLPIMIL